MFLLFIFGVGAVVLTKDSFLKCLIYIAEDVFFHRKGGVFSCAKLSLFNQVVLPGVRPWR